MVNNRHPFAMDHYHQWRARYFVLFGHSAHFARFPLYSTFHLESIEWVFYFISYLIFSPSSSYPSTSSHPHPIHMPSPISSNCCWLFLIVLIFSPVVMKCFTSNPFAPGCFHCFDQFSFFFALFSFFRWIIILIRICFDSIVWEF